MKNLQTNEKTHTSHSQKVQNAKDQKIYEQIFEAIMGRRLLPGVKLAEDNLASIFGVSRTVIRRALLRLSNDGIVDIRLNRGATIAKPTITQAKEVFAARRIIEREVVREATDRASFEDISNLRELVSQEQLLYQPEQRGRGLRFSGNFHIHLAEVSQNTTLTRFVKALVPQTSLIIALYEKPNQCACSPHEHSELLDIMGKKDPKRAIRKMDKHLQKIEDSLTLVNDKPYTDLGQVFSNKELD